MDSQKPKIEMYVKRPFGEKLNAAFDFIKENWKPLLKYTTYLILPLCLLQALGLNGLMGGAMTMRNLASAPGSDSSIIMSVLPYYILYVFLYMVGTIILSSLVYALVRTYNEREGRLEGITLRELSPLLLRNVKRLILAFLAYFLLLVVVSMLVGALAALSLFTLFLTIPLIIAFIIPLSLFIPIYLLENITLMEAFGKTYRLGFATWGGVLLMIVVMGIISGVLYGVAMTPWYVATLVKLFFSMSDTGSTTTVSVFYSFVLYILAVVQIFGAYLSAIFGFVGLVYQYGHASEVVDSITVETDIENFDKL